MKIDKPSKSQKNARELDKAGQPPKPLLRASRDCIDQFKQYLFKGSNAVMANSERPNLNLSEKLDSQGRYGIGSFSGGVKEEVIDKKLNLADQKGKPNNPDLKSEILADREIGANEKMRGSGAKDLAEARALNESKDLTSIKVFGDPKVASSNKNGDPVQAHKDLNLKIDFPQSRKPDIEKTESQKGEIQIPAQDSSDSIQPAVDISEQLLMARLDLNPFLQQSMTISAVPSTAQLSPTDLSARITETEEVKALINKYVSQLLVEQKSDAKHEPGHLMMRMGENLENMDLMISKNKYGDWQLRCTCPNQNTANWMQRMSKSLVKRFAERDLGVLKIDVELA